MKHIHHEEWYWFDDHAWNINASKSGIYTHILRPLLDRYNFMLTAHRKVFIYRFDLSISDHTKDNALLRDFGRRLRKRIKRHYKTGDVIFCWVREQEKAKKQHYHCLLMLNGSKVQHDHQLKAWITDIAASIELKPQWVKYHNLCRTDVDYEQKVQAACYHFSYLAKARGKGYRPPQTKDFAISRKRQ